MPVTDRSPSPPLPYLGAPVLRLREPRRSLEPRDELQRALNRIKGDGRRRLVADLFAMGMPIRRVPVLLRQESLSANQYDVLWRRASLDLAGELLPDLLPGEVEVVRVLWNLPKDPRVISLRARPGDRRLPSREAAWRAVADGPGETVVRRPFSGWPVDDEYVFHLVTGLLGAMTWEGALVPCWQQAKDLGFDREGTRRTLQIRSIDPRLGEALLPLVDGAFKTFCNFLGGPLAQGVVH